MKLKFKHPSVAGDMEVSDKLADFFVWLSLNHQDERAVSLLSLLAEHDRETNVQELEMCRERRPPETFHHAT